MPDKSSDEQSARAAATATVSSLNSDHSSDHLIADHVPATNQKPTSAKPSKSVTTSGSARRRRRRRLVVLLGLSQVVAGALLVGAGALGVVKGAALARVGAGLWAGCVAVVTGVVGVLAGINDCYGLNGNTRGGGSSPLLTGFLALSLLCLACGNSAAVLAVTGLQRDVTRPPPPAAPHSFQEEMDAWTPVLTNIALLIIASVHCLLSVVSIYHVSRRVCACLRPRQPYDHNQFEPPPPQSQPPPGKVAPYLVHLDERAEQKTHAAAERARHHELCKDLEVKLDADKHKKKEEQQFGSANSRERLVSSWLGGGGAAPAARGAGRVRKQRPPQPLVLVPAHPGHPGHPGHPAHPGHPTSTLGRMPVSVMMPPRYATLPLPMPLPTYAPPPHHHPHFYPLGYPVHDPRRGRRASPARHGGARRRRRREARDRDSQLTRSLERIHRKRAERERRAEQQLKSTYTGLDRAYAEQFIAVCDESRSQAHERSDSLTSSESEGSAPPPPPPPPQH